MKYVAFDIGNVICKMNFDGFLTKLTEIMNPKNESGYGSFSKQTAFDLMYKLQKVQDLGILSIREELSFTYGLHSKAIDMAVDEWNKTLTAEEFIINGILDLMSRGVQVALVSNIGSEHSSIMRNVLSPQVYDNSIKFFSCDVGARKPSYLYYKTFLDMYPEFKGCVYVDDRPENIATGIKFGFESCLFDLESFKSHSEMTQMFEAIELLVLK